MIIVISLLSVLVLLALCFGLYKLVTFVKSQEFKFTITRTKKETETTPGGYKTPYQNGNEIEFKRKMTKEELADKEQ